VADATAGTLEGDIEGTAAVVGPTAVVGGATDEDDEAGATDVVTAAGASGWPTTSVVDVSLPAVAKPTPAMTATTRAAPPSARRRRIRNRAVRRTSLAV